MLALLLVAAAQCPPGMVLLPAGRYTPGEEGRAPVQVKAFCLDVTEVKAAALEDKDCCATEKWPTVAKAPPPQRNAWCNVGKRPDHPANCVSWTDAHAYCAAQGKRLPTEDEWEWAARGTSRGTTFPWGNEAPGVRACWNRRVPEVLGTCPAGSRTGASPDGVRDLAGNVWEWTSTQVDCAPHGKCRVRRGGGWSSNDPSRLTASIRFADPEDARQNDVGFRCAADPHR